MTPDEMKTLIQRYIEAYNRMNVDELLATVHPDVEFKNVSGGVVNASTTGVSEQYAMGVILARKLPIISDLTFIGSVGLVYGLLSGIFFARAMAIVRTARVGR